MIRSALNRVKSYFRKPKRVPPTCNPKNTEVIAAEKVGDGESILMVNKRQLKSTKEVFENLSSFNDSVTSVEYEEDKDSAVKKPAPGTASSGGKKEENDVAVKKTAPGTASGGGSKNEEKDVGKEEDGPAKMITPGTASVGGLNGVGGRDSAETTTIGGGD